MSLSEKPSDSFYPSSEEIAETIRTIKSLDVCFVFDTTGSMMPYLEEAKAHARAEIEKIAKEFGTDVRYALVQYRDHPPQDAGFAGQAATGIGFALLPAGFDAALNLLAAAGGGDGPEAVWDGLVLAGNLDWRPQADHLVFLIGDAPPHGYAEGGDQWPDGCPCKLTAGGVIELFAAKRIRLHAHSIVGNQNTTRAFKEVAEGCHGDVTEVDRPAASTFAIADATTTTGRLHEVASSYATISSTPGMTFARTAKSLGLSSAATANLGDYLSDRGIETRKVVYGPDGTPRYEDEPTAV